MEDIDIAADIEFLKSQLSLPRPCRFGILDVNRQRAGLYVPPVYRVWVGNRLYEKIGDGVWNLILVMGGEDIR